MPLLPTLRRRPTRLLPLPTQQEAATAAPALTARLTAPPIFLTSRRRRHPLTWRLLLMPLLPSPHRGRLPRRTALEAMAPEATVREATVREALLGAAQVTKTVFNVRLSDLSIA